MKISKSRGEFTGLRREGLDLGAVDAREIWRLREHERNTRKSVVGEHWREKVEESADYSGKVRKS